MFLLKIIGIAFVAVVGYNVLKYSKQEFAGFVLIGAGCIILILLSEKIAEAVTVFQGIAQKANLNDAVFSMILKIIGIGYITEYSVSLCKDNGCSSIGKKIELAGKITIFLMAIPIISGIIELIGGIL
ncbi:stage III sporulation protein AD [bacterium]|nr:stage III sporulation protein AD [bacterium]